MKKLDWLILICLLFSPVIVNYLILGISIGGRVNGSLDGWLGFYGALVGSLITMFVLYRTRKWNKDDNDKTRQVQNRILEYQAKRVWLEGLRRQLDDNYRILNFQDTVFAVSAIISGDCDKALSYLLELNKKIEMQGYSFDLYYSTEILSEEETQYSECYNQVLRMYGSYVNDLIVICGIRQRMNNGPLIINYIKDTVEQLRAINKINNSVEPSPFLLDLLERVTSQCTYKDLEYVCRLRIDDTTIIHSAKENLAQVTKTLIQYEEQKIQGILQFND